MLCSDFTNMNWNSSEFAVNLGESINWLSLIIGIAVGMFGIYIWLYERKNTRKSTLYFPLFLACQGIVDVINKYEDLGEVTTRNILASCAKTLDDIVYMHGSIIYFKRVDDLSRFLSLKRAIDEHREFIEKQHWIALKDMLRSKEFKGIENHANALITRCKEEVKDLKKLAV